MSPEELEIRSEEVQEILGTPPGFLVRFGSTLALVTIVTLCWVGYWVKYPDTVRGKIRVTTTDPPRSLVAERSGIISRILVHNEDSVKAGQTLIVFQSNAKFEDVHILEDHVLAVQNINESSLLDFKPPKDLLLGELQDAVYDFLARQEALAAGRSRRLEKYSIGQLGQQIQNADNTIEYEKKRRENIQKLLNSVNQRYIREQNLLNSRLSTLEKVRDLQEEVLTYERMLQGIESTIKGKEIEIQMIRQEISGVRLGSTERQSSAYNELKQSFINLQNEIEKWKKEHLLVSPIDGVVFISNENIREKQFFPSETELMVVVPSKSMGIVGRVALDLTGSGKVQPGQKAIVKFDSYPFQEFGAVLGEVSWKGKIPSDNSLPIEVIFPRGLVTTTNRNIEAGQVMTGQVEIITEEKRFIMWIFQRFRSWAS